MNMISFLRGKIINKGDGYIILEVANVGYQVFITPIMFAEIDIGQEVEMYTHQYVREDTLDLFGFGSMDELELFKLLISISGIGPRSAIGVLSIAKTEDIKQSIASGDASLLTKVSGIGRKTAERVVLELKEKIGAINLGSGKKGFSTIANSDEIDALIALGYSASQARQALSEIDPKIKDSGDKIRAALKKL